MKKVLHIITGDHYAGAERVQDLLALRLPEYGYQVGFVCLKEGLFPEARQAKDAPVYQAHMRSQMDLAPAKRIAKVVREEDYVLVHTHTPRSALLGHFVALMGAVPLVHHLHSPTTRDTEERWRNFRNSLVERLSLLRARRIIAVSASLREYLREQGYGDKRVRLVENGVPVTAQQNVADPAQHADVIGMVALFRPRKGLEVLMRAAAILKSSGRSVRLRAVGGFETPEYESGIKALEKELGLVGHIDWVGFTRDVGAELRQMGVFALPSLFGEGMPMVVLEAMSAGLPVVATRVEGIPEVVREGQDGLLVPPSDPETLAVALGKLIGDPHALREKGQSGRQRQIQQFSDVSMARGVAAVYGEVLGS